MFFFEFSRIFSFFSFFDFEFSHIFSFQNTNPKRFVRMINKVADMWKWIKGHEILWGLVVYLLTITKRYGPIIDGIHRMRALLDIQKRMDLSWSQMFFLTTFLRIRFIFFTIPRYCLFFLFFSLSNSKVIFSVIMTISTGSNRVIHLPASDIDIFRYAWLCMDSVTKNMDVDMNQPFQTKKRVCFPSQNNLFFFAQHN